MDVINNYYKQIVMKGYHPEWFEYFVWKNFYFEEELKKYDAEYNRVGVDFPQPSFIDTITFKTQEGYMEFCLRWL